MSQNRDLEEIAQTVGINRYGMRILRSTEVPLHWPQFTGLYYTIGFVLRRIHQRYRKNYKSMKVPIFSLDRSRQRIGTFTVTVPPLLQDFGFSSFLP